MIRFRVSQSLAVAEQVADESVEQEYSGLFNKVCQAKNLLDGKPERDLRKRVTQCETVQANVIKDEILKKHPSLPPSNVTNAFVKFFEILCEYSSILPPLRRSMHYAEFPGSFVFALQVFLQKNGGDVLDWKMQSFSPPAPPLPTPAPDAVRPRGKYNKQNTAQTYAPVSKPLEDTFGLSKHHPTRLLCPEEAAYGDLTNVAAVRYYAEIFSESRVDIVTADGSIDHSSDYNKQEQMCLDLLCGEIASSCLSLRVGGCFICKVFGLLLPQTRSCIAFLHQHFATVDVVKPLTSRCSNSEFYLVCLDFRGVELSTKQQLLQDSRRVMTHVTDRKVVEQVSSSLLFFVRERTMQQIESLRLLADETQSPTRVVDLTLHWLTTCGLTSAE